MLIPPKISRLAMLAILPLMAFSIVIGSHFADSPAKITTAPLSGRLVVANLRDESISFFTVTDPRDALTLALPGPPHELLVQDGRIYATLGRANLLAEIEGHGGGVTRTLQLEGEPHGLALDTAQPNGANVLLVTLDKGNALVHVPIAGFQSAASEPAGNVPHTVAAAGGAVYITQSGDNRLLEAVSGRTAPTGALPESVAVSGQYVVTADSAGASLSIFDRQSLAPSATVPLAGHPVRVIAIDDSHAAVALGDASAVAIVDLRQHKVVRTIKTDDRPDGLCLAPSGGGIAGQIAVVSNAANSVRIYRLADGKQIAAFATAEGPGACLWLP